MNLRALLVGLIVLATAGFVIGVSIERSDHHTIEPAAPESHTGEGEGGHAEEAEGATSELEAHAASEEFQPFGIDIEATQFIVLAAIASGALAAAAWVRPIPAVLLLVGAAMLGFAVLDIREVVHQIDESETGLAILAGAVAVAHLAVAAVAGILALQAAGPAATVTA